MNMNDPIASLLGSWATELNLYSVLLRVAISVVFAAMIGCERASKRHAAGQRTFILVSLASTMAMLLDQSVERAGGSLVSAAAVIAIAIISSNSILYSSKNQIKGLTTSVALWACGVIGLTIGAGLYTVSVIAGGGFSAFYAFFERFDPLWPGLAQMPLAASVVGALFVGVGAGLSVRAGGAPGGDDALAMALHKVLRQPIERIYLGSDLVVLALSASYLPLERLACSLLTVLLSGQIIGLIQRIPSPFARKAAALESTNK